MSYSVEELKGEEWRPVVGYEGLYSVSSLGRVRREPYSMVLACGVIKSYPRSIKAASIREGYPRVHLYRNGRPCSKSVHVIVAEAFIGPKPVGFVVCHADSVRSNPRLANLRYATQKENCLDTVRAGRTNQGVKHCKALLTETDVRYIRSVYKQIPHRQLAVDMGVSSSAVYQAAVGLTWRHI